MEDKLEFRTQDTAFITGKSLRALRTGNKISQSEFAELLSENTGQEITQMKVSRWENSFEFPVDRDTLKIMLDILYK